MTAIKAIAGVENATDKPALAVEPDPATDAVAAEFKRLNPAASSIAVVFADNAGRFERPFVLTARAPGGAKIEVKGTFFPRTKLAAFSNTVTADAAAPKVHTRPPDADARRATLDELTPLMSRFHSYAQRRPLLSLGGSSVVGLGSSGTALVTGLGLDFALGFPLTVAAIAGTVGSLMLPALYDPKAEAQVIAADKAFRSGSYREAMQRYALAVALCLKNAPSPEENELAATAMEGVVAAASQLGYPYDEQAVNFRNKHFGQPASEA